MDRIKLYSADGTPLKDFIRKDRAIAQVSLARGANNNMIPIWDTIVKTLNEQGKFLKYQLKGIRKGQVIVCKK